MISTKLREGMRRYEYGGELEHELGLQVEQDSHSLRDEEKGSRSD